jgi:hypothetical protein
MRLLTCAALVALLACDPGTVSPSPSPTVSARPTLSAFTLASDVIAVKSSGRILAIDSGLLIVRVDRVNSGAQQPLDDVVVALRTDSDTSVQLVTTRNDRGVTPMDLVGIKVGDPITFMFEPRSLRRDDGSYLARVIGRFS